MCRIDFKQFAVVYYHIYLHPNDGGFSANSYIRRPLMKKAASGLLVLALIACIGFAFAGAGTSSDPLISKDYINSTFKESVIKDGESTISGSLNTVYGDAVEALNKKALEGSGYTYAPGYDSINVSSGKYLLVYPGGSLMLTSGSAKASTEGTIVNASEGKEVENGASVAKNQRYFSAENTVAVYEITSSAVCLVNGYYLVSNTADVPDAPPEADPPTDDPEIIFTDINDPSHWRYAPIYAAAKEGLVAGIGDGTYGYAGTLNWAQAVTFAVRLYQFNAGEHVYGPEDYVSGPWYGLYFDYAIEKGIIAEAPADPDAEIQRADAAVIFAAVLDGAEKVNEVPEGYFTDVSADHPAYEAIYKLTEAGGTVGIGGNQFGPDGVFQRDQVAAIIARLAGLVPPAKLA